MKSRKISVVVAIVLVLTMALPISAYAAAGNRADVPQFSPTYTFNGQEHEMKYLGDGRYAGVTPFGFGEENSDIIKGDVITRGEYPITGYMYHELNLNNYTLYMHCFIYTAPLQTKEVTCLYTASSQGNVLSKETITQNWYGTWSQVCLNGVTFSLTSLLGNQYGPYIVNYGATGEATGVNGFGYFYVAGWVGF